MCYRQHLMIICIIAAIVCLDTSLYGQESVANIHRFSGTVTVISNGIQREPYLKMDLFDGDVIATKNGRAAILFNDGTIVKMKQLTELTINDSADKEERDVKLNFGRVWFNLKDGAKPTNFSGPTSVAAIRGTQGEIALYGKSQIIRYGCAEGEFCVYAKVNGEMFVVCLKKGFYVIVYPNGKPSEPLPYIIGQIAGDHFFMFQQDDDTRKDDTRTGGSTGGSSASPSGRD